MKLLLHICCAPCLIYPLECLREEGFSVDGFFYNPNIHPFREYKNRKQAVADFSRAAGLDIVCPEYEPADFFRQVNLKGLSGLRCASCWSLRLKRTAVLAKEKGYDCFSTTLLVSPYQDQALLKEIGQGAAKKEGVDFYYADWREGFRKAHEAARGKGIYCQKYCGCIYSEIERCRKSEEH